jgi:hypothetical protein
MQVRSLSLLLAAALLATGPVAHAQSATGTVGIRIVDAPTSRSDDPRAKIYIVDHVAPGTTISRRVEVRNDTNQSQNIDLYAAAATVRDGGFLFGDGHAVNDLITWTKVDPPHVTLASSAKSFAVVTIAVPEKASAGERYGVVWAAITAPPPQGGGVGEVNRVGVRIYLSVGPGGEPPSDFEIIGIEAKRTTDGRPQVAATVKNTGGRALDLSGQLRLEKGPGGLSAGPFDATLGTTLGIGETEPVNVNLDKALPNGPWDAQITLESGLIERSAHATITFPKAAGAHGPNVKPAKSSKTGLLAAVVVVVLLVLLAGAFLVVRRRRGDASDGGGEGGV